ncbi:MAG TPA: serine/threonine-protein kinase [Isosphaeraceae bacterium]|jgi:serine/threonine protein kinase/WD40 repeat protein|nr:serine/threonine-protein kinase [Isosphaeraceae bacterium]
MDQPVYGSEIDPLDVLAEEFVNRLRKGDRPTTAEYAARYPALVDRIQALFPALVAMEEADTIAAPFAGFMGPASPVPERISEFLILRKIGEGGMGVVYEAVQESLGRHVALKVLSRPQDDTYQERFRREARTAAKLHHTNIVPVFAVGAASDVHYFAMQFIHGQGLDVVLQEVRALRALEANSAPRSSSLAASVAQGLRSGVFASAAHEEGEVSSPVTGATSHSDLSGPSETRYYREVARLGAQAAEGLAYAHGQGVLHRDIKPSNLLLDTQGTLWISDFGLAKADDSDDLTHTGDLVGTVRYMAPERFRGRADARSDVYSLGATLYEMLTLRAAFDASDRLELIERISRESPPRLRRHDPRVPRDLETLVQKAMAREPADRYPTAAALADDLRRFLADRSVRARRATAPEQLWRWWRRNPTMAGLAFSIAMLLVALAVGSLLVALKMGQARDKALGLSGRARAAELETSRQLARSLLDQARAGRFSRRPGQRFLSLDAVRRATAIGRQLGEPEEYFRALRTEAIGNLALPDIRFTKTWEPRAADSASYRFDAALKHYVSADSEGHIRVALTQSDEETARLEGYPGSQTIRLSSDGRIVAVRSSSGGCRAWDLSGPVPVLVCDEHAGILGHDLRPDGGELALGLADGTILLKDLRSKQPARTLKAVRISHDVVYSPSGEALAVVGTHAVEILDLATGLSVADLLQTSGVLLVAWNPDGCGLAVACDDVQIHLWDVPSRTLLKSLMGRTHSGALAFSPNGDLLASAAWDNVSRLWDPRGGFLRLAVSGMSFTQFDARGEFLAAVAGHGLSLAEVAPGREYRTLARPTIPEVVVEGIAMHPGGRLLAAPLRQGVGIWDLASARFLGILPGSCYRLAFTGRGDLITHGTKGLLFWPVQAGPGKSLRIGPPQRIPAPEPDAIMAVTTSRDGRTIAFTSREGLFVLQRDRPDRPVKLAPQADVRGLAVSPDGRWVAAASWTTAGGVNVYDAATGRLEKHFSAPRHGFAAFSPNGRWLVTGTLWASQQLWKADTWEPGPIVAGVAVSFTGDDQLLAVAEVDGTIRLLRPETGRELARFEPPDQDGVYWLAFSPDGTRLAVSCPRDETNYVWDLRLIRRELRELGLDFDAPTLPDRGPEPPLELEVVGAVPAAAASGNGPG